MFQNPSQKVVIFLIQFLSDEIFIIFRSMGMIMQKVLYTVENSKI